jgi:hypothetical protein
VIDCYRLANWYKQNPETFLAMPLETVAMHRRRTAQLWEIMAREKRDAEDNG